LYSALPEPELITKKGVEKLFQQSILSALTFHENSIEITPLQLDRSLQQLESALTAAPQQFGVYHPIVGLDQDGLPAEVGSYRFMIFSDDEFDRFSDTTAEDLDSKIVTHRAFLRDKLKKQILDAPVAYREVAALESNAAKDRALQDLQATLDVINFFSDLVPYNYAHLSVPGDRDGASVTVPIRHLDTKSTSTVHRQRVGRLGKLSMKGLLEIDASSIIALTKASELLRSKRNKMEEVFLASIRWAGRATTSDRNEEAFLLYVIALESLMLADQTQGELSYRLRLRVARLLGRDGESRREIAKRVGDLYGIRSKIVHSGHYEVSDADLSLARLVVKNCIIALANDDSFWQFHTPQTFGSWMESRIHE
jgi:hypothetical protein